MSELFYTNRLSIRHWEHDDCIPLAKAMNSIIVSKAFNTPYPYTLFDAKKYIEKTSLNQNNSIYYAVIEKTSKLLIGGGGIYNKNSLYFIGIWLRDDKQNQGYGTEILKGALEYAFDTMQISEVFACFYDWNLRSKQLCDKFGFSLKKHVDEKNEKKSIVSITRNEYSLKKSHLSALI